MSVFDKINHVENVLTGMDKALEDYGESLMNSVEVDHLMVDANIAQMQEGERADGSRITPEYTQNTIEIKESKGQPIDRVTLKDTGDFRLNMKVKTSSSKVELLSTDSKSDHLQAKYGEGIFGLNDQHLAMLRGYLKPKFQLFLRNYIKT